MITLKQVDPAAAMHLKAVRLAALKDSPTAFGSTFENESKLSDADWRQRVAERDGTRSITFLAWEDETPCGIAAGFITLDNPTQAHVVSVWVAPTHRKRGVGRQLMLAVAHWGVSRHVTDLFLMVTSNNQPAIVFYQDLGFKMTGDTKPYPNDTALVEYEMAAKASHIVERSKSTV